MEPRGDTTTVQLKITGRVQGVWYRGWAVDKANALGLSGWVRNVTDGSVEALVNGSQAKVDEMIAACRKGPVLARVDDIKTHVVDPPGYGGAFPTTGFDKLGDFDPSEMPIESSPPG